MNKAQIYMWLADNPVGNHNPEAPGGKGGKLDDALGNLISWSMYVGLMLCAVAFIVGACMAAIGANSARPDMAERGKRAALWALVGAALIGMGVFLVNTFYNIA